MEKERNVGLNLNLLDINIIKTHRFLQRPISKQGERLIRPIIVELSNVLEKQKILSASKSLKTFYDIRIAENIQSVYVTEHLPKLFQEQKKSLLLQFKEAKMKKLMAVWRIVNGSYCLFVENEKISPCHSDKESNESSDSEIRSQSSEIS